ncbi:DivIVA domain-containing protein [Weissella sagaensis]|jgi:cell division initiation protein|uniref:DivIVA domain-containing protein n=1 Tax=Weissella sagaensis TaxID=2559928 RepID=A0ABW1RSW6_9LACO|nr:DivIVA domain-containing protein [Weissella sagaensis]KAA8433035.1 DivIVA domain-containing protein [Weissella paramesenteroides]MBU7568303.1 DivIVA domain-containing protein [Weissella hellenica]KAA8437979.1 DivIVA domain-containing protein [Weissella paramesenteroides]QDJ59161.1 DivIVA domain-containing protein [Weissella hellenica]QEA56453.1 DivIVA domain-containing protein [Weissella hellenica]
MTLTPQEIHAKEFTTSRNKWYDKTEVTDFLDRIVDDFDSLLQENQTLKTQLAEADANAKQVEEMKQSVNSSILIAQEAADRLKKQTEAEAEAALQQAQAEAQKIVMEANAKANALLTDSQTKNESLVAEKEGLDQEMGAFKAKIEGLLRAQLDMVQTDEWNAFQTPAAYQEPSAAAVSQQTEEETPQVDQDTETVVIFPEDSEDSENFLNKDK